MRMTNALGVSLLATAVLGAPHVKAAQPSTPILIGPDTLLGQSGQPAVTLH